jgi:hypothetical protein
MKEAMKEITTLPKPSAFAVTNVIARFNWRDHAAELYRQNKILAATLGLTLVLIICMAAVLPFDSRLVMGTNPWIKPIKFALSFSVYVYTIARLLEYLRLSDRGKKIIGWGVSACVLVQIVCITSQAAQGTTSHFNTNTPLNTVISHTMDIIDPVNSLFVIALLIFACLGRYDVTRPCLWGIRSGIAVFLGASAIGIAMVMHGAHCMGVADGGPGLPVLNWSTAGGDLRVAHFLGLHALQALPAGAWLISKHRSWTASLKTCLVLALSGAFASIVAVLYLQAMHGAPFLKM